MLAKGAKEGGKIGYQYGKVTGNIVKETAKGAGYDYTYKNHWRITSINGYIEVGFKGNYDLVFHALGSTINGISYCYIDIYVNNKIYDSHKFINESWQDYQISANKFSSSWNNVKIVLKGDTHFWIDEIKLR